MTMFFAPIVVGPRPPRRPWTERKPPRPTDEEIAAELLLAQHLEAFDAGAADANCFEDDDADARSRDDDDGCVVRSHEQEDSQ